MTQRPAARPRDLRRPILHAGTDLTLLTGENVDLAPEAVIRGSGDRLDAPGPGLPVLAFSRASRNGLAGLRGRVTVSEGGPVLTVARVFGSPAALAHLGEVLGDYLADRGRFPDPVRVEAPEACEGLGGAALLDALSDALGEPSPAPAA